MLLFLRFLHFLFPKESPQGFQSLSQIRLVLFMFIVGLELDLNELKKQAKSVFIISSASILFPFDLGMVAAVYLYPIFKLENQTSLSFILFMGISFCITAFPVLARIILERKM